MKSPFLLMAVSLLASMCLLAIGCGDDDDIWNATGGDSDADADADGDADTGTIDGFALLQGQTEHTGVEVVINELTGFQGHTDSTGTYSILDVPTGAYTVTATLAGYADQTSSPFSVAAGETTTVPPLTLSSALGDLEGYVQLQGTDDHSGTAVSIQDTSYATETGADGFWSFEGIEAGQYRIDATHEDYLPNEATDITVVAGQVSTAPPITLTEAIWQGNYTITNQSELEALKGYVAVKGNLTIESPSLENVDGLESLERIGSLTVGNNGALEDIGGLGGLVTIEQVGEIRFEQNPALTSLKGLDGITSPSVIYVADNDSLVNLDGLDSLSTLGGLIIIDNDSLLNLKGLDGVTVVESGLTIQENGALESLDGLENLKELHNSLVIWDNPALSSVQTLLGVTTFEGDFGGDFFRITGNALLPTCDAIELKDKFQLPSQSGVCIEDNKPDTCPDDCIPI